MMWPRWLLTGSMKYTKWWPTYATSGRHSPELVDDVSWQEVDVIVGQRHTSILHPLPENNISQRNLLCKFWFLTCEAGWVFPRPTKKVSESRSVFNEAEETKHDSNIIILLLRCPLPSSPETWVAHGGPSASSLPGSRNLRQQNILCPKKDLFR